MYYHNKRCFDLIESFCAKYNHTFDTVIRFRADLNIQSNLDILEKMPFKKNTVYVPTCRWKINEKDMDDMVAFGDYESMKVYSDLASNIVRYCVHEKYIIHPESLIKYHLDSQKINIEPSDFTFVMYTSRHLYDQYLKNISGPKKKNIFASLLTQFPIFLGFALLLFLSTGRSR